MPAEVGEAAPEFTLASVNEVAISLGQYHASKNVVLSFHVLNFTGG